MSTVIFNTDKFRMVSVLTTIGFFTVEIDHDDCDECCEVIEDLPFSDIADDPDTDFGIACSGHGGIYRGNAHRHRG